MELNFYVKASNHFSMFNSITALRKIEMITLFDLNFNKDFKYFFLIIRLPYYNYYICIIAEYIETPQHVNLLTSSFSFPFSSWLSLSWNEWFLLIEEFLWSDVFDALYVNINWCTVISNVARRGYEKSVAWNNG